MLEQQLIERYRAISWALDSIDASLAEIVRDTRTLDAYVRTAILLENVARTCNKRARELRALARANKSLGDLASTLTKATRE